MPILVHTPARLHLGQIDLNGSIGRIFGGVGVAIEKPGVQLLLEKNDSLEVSGPGASLVRKLVLRYFDHFKLPHQAKITVLSLIPAHTGLGSGTQLRLAIASGLTRLLGKDIPPDELYGIMNHGESRSAIGTAAFAGGGFILDGGFKTGQSPAEGRVKSSPPVLLSREFPRNWYAVIVIPEDKGGLHGKAEKDAFEKMDPIAEEKVGKICRYLLMRLLPALVEEDSESFGQALGAIQDIIGNHFAAVQGGLFSSKISAEVAAYCMKNGAFVASQSSWGPAMYAFVEGQEKAGNLSHKVERYLEANSWDGKVFVTAPANKGAVIVELTEGEVEDYKKARR